MIELMKGNENITFSVMTLAMTLIFTFILIFAWLENKQKKTNKEIKKWEDR